MAPRGEPLELEPAELLALEPTEGDLEVAYDCLRKVPWDVQPVQHLGRIIARYRLRLAAEGPK